MTIANSPLKSSAFTQLRPITSLVNFILGVKPLAHLMKQQARKMMINRAEQIGVAWRKQVAFLNTQNLDTLRAEIENPALNYPDYYLTSFHAYDEGNMGWLPATEVEVAALAVHAKIWSKGGEITGDRQLRDSFCEVLSRRLPQAPQAVVDLGCSVGMSTARLQEQYPQATFTGIDLSPYFLAVAMFRDRERCAAGTVQPTRWLHAAAEATTLADASCDLVTLFLVCHELPQEATRQIFQEARRILRPGGHLAIMDMNPQAEAYAKLPPYVFTLLKSTEPYLDEYFSLDVAQTLVEAGFEMPTIDQNSPRHRTIVAAVR